MNAMDRILELTDEVEQQIGSGDWLSASETDAERRRLLSALLDADGIGRLDPQDRQSLREILRRTNDTMAEVVQLKRDLLKTSRRFQSAPKALHSYRENVQADTLAQLRD